MKRAAPVPITGVGCLCAAGMNLQQCMDSLFRGTRHAAPPTRFETSHPVNYPVFEVHADIPTTALHHGVELGRTSRLAVAAAIQAVQDARWIPEQLRSRRVGVCMGTTVGSAMNSEEFYRQYRQAEDPDMDPVIRFLAGNPATAVARELGLTGPCQTVVNACSSGTDAVGLGAFWIRSGICDVVIAGGADELCRVTYNGFISLMISDDSPCRPFDRDRKGLNLGEGAAVLVLESDQTSQARMKKARSFVLGYGSASDAYHLTAPRPDGSGLRRAISEALNHCGRSAEEVAFVNAHGTGTPDNDRVECRILQEVLPGVPFFSTKGYTGHALGAAGALEAAFTVACLEQGRIPQSVGFATKDPELPACPVKHPTTVTGDIAISESLAFGGQNAVVIFGKEGA